jgi:hypothetical protein
MRRVQNRLTVRDLIMRDIPKAQVAALVHDRGLLAGLIAAAASGTEIAPAASALIAAVMDQSITAIDLDDPQYQAGVAGLVAYGVITQADADAVGALFRTWVYVGYQIAGNTGFLVYRCGSDERSISINHEMTEEAAAILAENLRGSL